MDKADNVLFLGDALNENKCGFKGLKIYSLGFLCHYIGNGALVVIFWRTKPPLKCFFAACSCVVDLFVMEIAIVNRVIDNVYFSA